MRIILIALLTLVIKSNSMDIPPLKTEEQKQKEALLEQWANDSEQEPEQNYMPGINYQDMEEEEKAKFIAEILYECVKDKNFLTEETLQNKEKTLEVRLKKKQKPNNPTKKVSCNISKENEALKKEITKYIVNRSKLESFFSEIKQYDKCPIKLNSGRNCKFKNKGNIKNLYLHLKFHFDVRNYYCKECIKMGIFKSQIQMTNLKSHISNKHPESDTEANIGILIKK